jgi:hypothetical protein
MYDCTSDDSAKRETTNRETQPSKRPIPYRLLGLNKCGNPHSDFILFMHLHSVASDQIGYRLSKMKANVQPRNSVALADDIDRRLKVIIDDMVGCVDAERVVTNILARVGPDRHVLLQYAQRAMNAERSVKDSPVS